MTGVSEKVLVSFSLALAVGTGCLDVGEFGCFGFEFLTKGPLREKLLLAADRKAGPKLLVLIGLMTHQEERVGPGQTTGSLQRKFQLRLDPLWDREQYT